MLIKIVNQSEKEAHILKVIIIAGSQGIDAGNGSLKVKCNQLGAHVEDVE